MVLYDIFSSRAMVDTASQHTPSQLAPPCRYTSMVRLGHHPIPLDLPIAHRVAVLAHHVVGVALDGVGHFVTCPGGLLDGQAYRVQAGRSAGASRLGGEGAAHSFGGVDSLSLLPAPKLYKSCACCLGERKYFSGTSGVKIADKVHPAARLRDAEIFAVKHLPFHTIPQSIQRMEDGRKCPALVMAEQAGYVLQQEIRRVPGFNQPGNFKEQGASWVCEASSLSSQGKRLAGKPAAEQVEIGQSGGICCSDVLTEPLSFHGEQGVVALVGTLVDLAVAHTGKAAGAGKPLPEPAYTGKQVDELDSRYISPF